jgi:hypothetical protein
MVYYHITRPWYVLSILYKGLIPRYKRGITCGKRQPYIWLTDDPLYIVETQLVPGWKYSVLEVNCDNLYVKPYITYYKSIPEVVCHQYKYNDVISSERIKVITFS